MSGEIWRTQGFGPVFASLLYNSVILTNLESRFIFLRLIRPPT